ncbi:hypothetical protein CW731_02270 [Polaribacter sp. ALD11]|uniref:DUF6048 family protein n=1 Tax=Polaribacter sp. ALD11 TaxID=2058137 RepID=UPI000C30DA2B|nr:DUF6048 family protein [Polaribacter sp. ALD11]AUC84194.1 hypothetical protein CW731_02270 [Polaribacter sp. ALD11]
MYKYFISICLLFVFAEGFSQEQKKDTLLSKEIDTVIYKTNYGFRLGIDISKPIKAIVDGAYSGFEIVGDYRIKKNLYIAAEIGYEEETSAEDFSNSTSKGNYIRLGVNYNAYKNWLDMNNEIFVGYRYGFSLFDQTLNSYTPNVSDAENGNYFPANLNTAARSATNLNAHWSELMLGIKAESFKNFYVSFSVSYKVLMSVKDPKDFKSLFAPGFNRIFESNTGFGFNYTLSYLIPFSKK